MQRFAPALTLLLLVAGWEALVRAAHIPHYTLPAPSLVLQTLWTHLGSLAASWWFTLKITFGALLLACGQQLNPGGSIYVRDGFHAPGAPHERTRWTERLSTGIGFNKAKGELHFMTKADLLAIAAEAGLHVEWALADPRTSNELAVLSRR